MIKFFRRVRRQLLTENKFSKYLLYAIGEIILVVIGILIALQINSWNQLKKDRQEENDLLHRISKNLERDLIDLDMLLEWNKGIKEDLRLVISGIVERELTVEELTAKYQSLINYNYFIQVSSSYQESLASGKISLIQNDSLRNLIIEHYERSELGADHTLKNHMDNYLQPISFKTFGHKKNFISYVLQKPNDLEQLNMNEVYDNSEYLAALTNKLAIIP